jgi:hypothetical protein
MLNTSAITNITSTRIWHGNRPQSDTTYPCINYYELSTGNNPGLESQPFSINCRAETAGESRNLAQIVKDNLVGTSRTGIYGTVNGFDWDRVSLIRDQGLIPEPDGDIYNTPVDIRIVYSLSTIS